RRASPIRSFSSLESRPREAGADYQGPIPLPLHSSLIMDGAILAVRSAVLWAMKAVGGRRRQGMARHGNVSNARSDENEKKGQRQCRTTTFLAGPRGWPCPLHPWGALKRVGPRNRVPVPSRPLRSRLLVGKSWQAQDGRRLHDAAGEMSMASKDLKGSRNTFSISRQSRATVHPRVMQPAQPAIVINRVRESSRYLMAIYI
ncbi:hypothetical protein IAQ61_010278, partial [Plenodomus lingam]|uniref:uncharacterized protein n=1 Tax=Leptosphaeria maculans TaxID=5022 RepID=UPI0033297ED5